MKKIIQYDLLSQIFLIISLILIGASFFFKGGSFYQYEIIFIAVAIYLISSTIHHYFDKSLTLEVGLEYVLIALLTILVVFGLAI
jgi:Sec-independent protein secretion pathway component TatC